MPKVSHLLYAAQHVAYSDSRDHFSTEEKYPHRRMTKSDSSAHPHVGEGKYDLVASFYVCASKYRYSNELHIIGSVGELSARAVASSGGDREIH